MLQYHYNSLSKALVELFPDIGINRNTLKGIVSLFSHFLLYFLSRFFKYLFQICGENQVGEDSLRTMQGNTTSML